MPVPPGRSPPSSVGRPEHVGGEIAPADGIEHERARAQGVAEAFDAQRTEGTAGSALGRHEVAPSIDGELEHRSVDRRRRDVGRLGGGGAPWTKIATARCSSAWSTAACRLIAAKASAAPASPVIVRFVTRR